MELSKQTNWILSTVDLNICVRLLGREDWRDLPAPAGEQALGRRMLDSFLELVRLGLVRPDGDGYARTELLEERLEPVAWPEWSATLYREKEPALSLYGAKGELRLVERLEGDRCRVSPCQRREALALAEKWAAEGGRLELRDKTGEFIPDEKACLKALIAGGEEP